MNVHPNFMVKEDTKGSGRKANKKPNKIPNNLTFTSREFPREIHPKMKSMSKTEVLGLATRQGI